MSHKDKNLYYLHELPDYKVASDSPDVRGWEVRDAYNRTIGKVDRLLVDKTAKCVVYLEVKVDESILEDDYKTYAIPVSDVVPVSLNEDGSDRLILPVEKVRLDEENKIVLTK
ncbi:MAG: PRC-barrel domain-containing protein [Bacteroidota bacterium]|nr:PRC-barrel domain-containing protein [Flavisolibacter sp.]MBD0376225.1 PRC-barrel domain-containing protein [Flavisolibacter sp.]MDQ3844260.1 PRC-barrel domain-containing protein [Bacteroidota bacterium]